MGAVTFHDTISKKEHARVKDAFKAAVDAATHMYGHRRYSGTISSKPGFVPFPANGRSLDLISADDVQEALKENEEAEARLLTQYPRLATELHMAQGLYDDKYAPAVAFLHGDDWHFVGWTPE